MNRALGRTLPWVETSLGNDPQAMSMTCPECKRLEIEYQSAVEEIRAVTNGTFKTVREKMKLLFEKQNKRDRAIRSLYLHQNTHRQKVDPPPIE